MTPGDFYPALQLLVDAIADAVAERLHTDRGTVSESSPPADCMLDGYQAAELLGCSKPHLDRLVRDHKVPSVKLGHLRRYRRSELLAIQSSNKKGGGCDA